MCHTTQKQIIDFFPTWFSCAPFHTELHLLMKAFNLTFKRYKRMMDTSQAWLAHGREEEEKTWMPSADGNSILREWITTPFVKCSCNIFEDRLMWRFNVAYCLRGRCLLIGRWEKCFVSTMAMTTRQLLVWHVIYIVMFSLHNGDDGWTDEH